MTGPGRIPALDVLRGVALCGVLLVNITFMGGSWLQTRPLEDAGGLDWGVWWTQQALVEGAMRGLFTLLFGAGAVLMLRGGAVAYHRRAFVLIGLGLLDVFVLLWPGDILWTYGLAALLLYPFSRLSLRRLWQATGALLAVCTLWLGGYALSSAEPLRAGRAAQEAAARGEALTEAQRAALEERATILKDSRPSPEALAEEAIARRGWSAAARWTPGALALIAGGGNGVFLVFESLAFMVLGMALLKSGVLGGERSGRFYALLAAAGFGIGLPMRAVWLWLQQQGEFLPRPEFWIWGAVYELHRLPMTLGWLGLVLAIWRAGLFGGAGAALAAMGRMTLSHYLGQSLMAAVLFYGLGLYGLFGWAQLWLIAAAMLSAQAAVSLIWLRRWRQGPAEWLLRSLARGRAQPWRRAADN